MVATTDTTRLRRLDALFAERVLGTYDPQEMETAPGHVTADELPPYTRSLDAAWEGAANLRGELFSYGIELGWQDGLSVAVMVFPRDGLRYSCSATHPAEALVLACLRAVGVEESELQ